MKSIKILFILFLFNLLLPPLAYSKKCSGGSNCTACSSCNYCGNCAKRGGSCSVCIRNDYSSSKNIFKKIIPIFWWIIPLGFILYLIYPTSKKDIKKDK